MKFNKLLSMPFFSFLLISFLFINPLYAHHGKDFILTQSAILPHPGDIYFIPKAALLTLDDEYSTEIEPSVLFGAGDWVALELHSHISNEGHGSFSYEATAPSVLFNLFNSESGFNLGLSMEYEFSHSHHHPDNFESRISASQTLDTNLFALNLISEKAQPSAVEWGYSIAAKNALSNYLALGVELQNDFKNEQGEVIALVLFNLNKHLDFNFGFGTGLNKQIDFSFYASVVLEL